MHLPLSAFLLPALLAVSPAAADPVVVELFTSQGCSSCPAADAMLGGLTGREDVIALSLHVDYWDWIGWADTFADPAYGARQLDYAEAAGSDIRYTPQFVIGGADRMAGPSAMELLNVIRAHDGATGDVLRAQGRNVTVAGTGVAGQLIVVSYRPEATVLILHGENAGKSVTYSNIVSDWTVVQGLDGTPTTQHVPAGPAGEVQVVLAQAVENGHPGPILGAVRLD